MIVTLIPLLLIITLKTSRCSLVIDSGYQTGLYLSDYCPKMQDCTEGTHVMCMFYDPHNPYGPMCADPLNVTVTADRANLILDLINAIRSKVANGKETGKGGALLPRGYGIFRLKWDSELATFAHVTANRCILRHDLCRATRRFSFPTQAASFIPFYYPGWKTMPTDKELDKVDGLTIGKIKHAIFESLKSWYYHKTFITEDMVKECPDWTAEPVDTRGRLYLEMIYGYATHVGCGMSGYSEYKYSGNAKKKYSYAVQLVCNFSSGPSRGQPSYEVNPPITGHGYSPRCGCPPGSNEDSDCLCNEASTGQTCPLGEPAENCEPTLVLLPIFTMEDAPPEKLFQIAEDMKDPLKDFILKRLDNTSDNNVIGRQKPTERHPLAEIFDFNNEKDVENDIWHGPLKPILDQTRHKKLQTHLGPKKPPPPPPLPPPTPPRPPPRLRLPAPKPLVNFRTPHYQSHKAPPPIPPRIPPKIPPPMREHTNRPLPRLPPRNRLVTKVPYKGKSSIITKTPQFNYAKRKKNTLPVPIVKYNGVSRNKNLHRVVNDYLKRSTEPETVDDNQEQNNPKESQNPYTDYSSSETDVVVTETGLTKAEEVVINFNQYLKQKNNSKFNDKDTDIKDDNDNKLMSLLDNLEQEVKHAALDGNEKELFDAKLRKIYGTIIGKTASEKFPKTILLNTAHSEDVEIDFGQTKSVDKHERNHGQDEVAEEPIKRTKHHQISKKIEREKSHDYLAHKRKNKIIDNYEDNKPSEVSNHLYNDNFDVSHGEEEDLDHKYTENVNKKKSVHNDVPHKYNDNSNRQHHYQSVKKPVDDVPDIIKKYEVTKAVFREFGNSQEDLKPNQDISDGKGLISKDIEKIKRTERIHRSKVKSLNSHNILDDPLDLERKKYYQDKLYNIRKKLRSQKIRRTPKNDRSVRSKNRADSRTKSSKTDDFFMPEKPGFLHGF